MWNSSCKEAFRGLVPFSKAPELIFASAASTPHPNFKCLERGHWETENKPQGQVCEPFEKKAGSPCLRWVDGFKA